MNSLLDDVNALLKLNVGNSERLNHIKETLELKKHLYVSDREYLTKLTQIHITSQTEEKTNSSYSRLKSSGMSDDELYRDNELSPKKKTAPVANTTIQSFCTNCGEKIVPDSEFCTNCGNSMRGKPSQTYVNSSQLNQVPPVGRIWYLLPLFLGWIGGIIGYFLTKDRNPKRAKKILLVGIIPTIIGFGIVFGIAGFAGLSALNSENSYIENSLSQFSQEVQEIKRIQIQNCENNMGYLQSSELGDMIKDRCIQGILGN